MRYYVVSDVHSFYSHMITALTDAGYYKDTEPHKLIICGDFFDRGPEPLEMQNFILSHLEADDVILITGNHEQLLYELATKDKGVAYQHHLYNGTWKTGVAFADLPNEIAYMYNEEFASLLKTKPFFKEILPKCRNYYEAEHYIFVHGWIPISSRKGKIIYKPDWRDASAKKWKEAVWHNGMDMACKYHITEPGKTIVCGHWHTSYGHSVYEGKGEEFGADADFSPFKADGILAIDACTAYSGKVNCVVIED